MTMSEKGCKRIALIQPPRKIGTLYSFIPVGLLSIASYIKQHGFEPIFIDLHMFSIIEKNHSDFFKQMAGKILSYNPDIVCFSVMCNNLPIALLIAKECKKQASEIPIIFGGPEVSIEEVGILETFPQVDIIVRGEGEETSLELFEALGKKITLSNVLGITYKEGNHIKKNPDRPFIKDLDQLPFLDFSLVPNLKMYEGVVEAGRGCPFACTFCSSCKIWKRKFRMKSALRLAQELKQTHNLFKNLYIEIIHDHFLASRKFADEFLSLIENDGITWGCVSRFDILDETLVRKLEKAGCRLICFGVETGSPEMQKKIKKNLPLEKLPKTLKMFSQTEIMVFLCFVIGFPNETESQINETLLLALNSKVINPSIDVHIFQLTFLKGSEVYAQVKENFGQYVFRESHCSPLTTDHPEVISLIKSYPYIFPSFYYIGNDPHQAIVLQKISNIFSFLIRSYAQSTLDLIKYLSLTPYQLGQKLSSFFEIEGVDLNPTKGYLCPQFTVPLKKFIRENAAPLYKEFFWWDEKFEKWEKQKAEEKLKNERIKAPTAD